MDDRFRKILEDIDPSARRAHLLRMKAGLEDRFMDTVADLEAQKRLRKRHEQAGSDATILDGLRIAEERVKIMADQLVDELDRVAKQIEDVKGAGLPSD